MNEQNKQKHPSSRKAHLRVMAILSIVVVVVGIVALNIGMDVLEKQMPIAVDLTSDSTFTMSDNSVTLAKGIGQNEQIGNTEIVVFVNEKLFTNNDYTSYPMMYELKEVAIQSAGTADGQQMYNRLLESFETVLDQFYYMLKQYQVESGGKITHRFIDVDANPALAAAYQEYEIGAGTVLFLNEDGTRSQKFELLNMISLDQQASTTEYNSDAERLVASCLNLVTAVDSKKATFLLGHGEDDTLVNTLQQFLVNNACDVAALDITASKTPEEDTDVFVIAAPTVDYSAEEIALLRKWLENDGKRGRDLLVVTDPS
ncbi:MAG: Gldg family protein, partial [Oscillospiraceae bacterium]|nr:Gldg family protein [Oscillospiraceae bacterium]